MTKEPFIAHSELTNGCGIKIVLCMFVATVKAIQRKEQSIHMNPTLVSHYRYCKDCGAKVIMGSEDYDEDSD